MIPVLYALLAGLGNVLGGSVIALRKGASHRLLDFFVAFGAGFMLSVAFIEMAPAALGAPGGVTAILLGYLAVHFTQHVLTPHFHFGVETHSEAMVSRGIGAWALIGLTPHSFFDGVAISAGYAQDPRLGLLIFLSVLLHKVPTGVSLSSIMLASGFSPRGALVGVGGIAVATVLGAAVTPLAGGLARYGLGLAAGVTVYVAASNLIPESQKRRGVAVPAGVALGVVAFYLARALLPH